MLRFDVLELHGAAVARLSGYAEGDCGWQPHADAQREAYLRAAGITPEHLVSVRQVHGREIAVVTEADRGCGAGIEALRTAPLADGLVTDVPGLPLGITVADCVPVFLVSREAIGLVHAGREGTRQAISQAAVHALGEHYGTTPEAIRALVGPSAGPCCYEVGEPMAREWEAQGLPVRGRFLDLWETNRQQLRDVGVPDRQIHVSGQCTICGGHYHSHRKDQGTARNLAVLCR